MNSKVNIDNVLNQNKFDVMELEVDVNENTFEQIDSQWRHYFCQRSQECKDNQERLKRNSLLSSVAW